MKFCIPDYEADLYSPESRVIGREGVALWVAVRDEIAAWHIRPNRIP